ALLRDPRCHAALEVAERFADGAATDAERAAAQQAAGDAVESVRDVPVLGILGVSLSAQPTTTRTYRLAARAAAEALASPLSAESVALMVTQAALHVATEREDPRWAAEAAGAAAREHLLRDIVGNPFRSMPPGCEAIRPLAEEVYQAGDFNGQRVRILGEGLQENGVWAQGEH